MREFDWAAMRGAVAVFVLALVLGGAALVGAVRFHEETALDYGRQKKKLESIRSRYQTIDEQRRLIETWLAPFRELQAAGIVGQERRLEWIEALREVAARVKLPSLRYRIERRGVHETGLALDTTTWRSFSTVVRIEAGLLHEGDFERLVRELEIRGAGLHRIERCDIRRTGPDFVMRPGAVNLTAECDLRWITLARTEAPT